MTAITPVRSSAPASASSPTASAGAALGKDDFLKLLITQLRYQEPLNPLDQNQFMTQTAQFSSLESLQNIDRGLASLQSTMGGSALMQAATLLGKTAVASGADFAFDGGGTSLPFALDADASAVSVQLVDANGTVVQTLESGPLSAGGHAITWDGADSSGTPMSPGTYHYRVSAQGAHAAAAAGSIDGIHTDGGTLTYLIGGATVRQDDLVDVR
jgi:flagellar basal-body rod modification protein FlgD